MIDTQVLLLAEHFSFSNDGSLLIWPPRLSAVFDALFPVYQLPGARPVTTRIEAYDRTLTLHRQGDIFALRHHSTGVDQVSATVDVALTVDEQLLMEHCFFVVHEARLRAGLGHLGHRVPDLLLIECLLRGSEAACEVLTPHASLQASLESLSEQRGAENPPAGCVVVPVVMEESQLRRRTQFGLGLVGETAGWHMLRAHLQRMHAAALLHVLPSTVFAVLGSGGTGKSALAGVAAGRLAATVYASGPSLTGFPVSAFMQPLLGALRKFAGRDVRYGLAMLRTFALNCYGVAIARPRRFLDLEDGAGSAMLFTDIFRGLIALDTHRS